MKWSLFSNPCGCCGGCDGKTYGFDEGKWQGVVDCYDGFTDNYDYIENLKDDIDQIDNCCVVFMGNYNTCSNAIRFPEAQWAKIKEWVEAGGRLWINAEYGGCLKDAGELSSFLEYLGVDLQWVGSAYDCGCREDFMLPGEANIARYIFDAQMGCTAEISGFSVVFYAPVHTDIPVVCVDSLNEGFVFLCGDSNFWAGCDYDNCTILERLFTYKDIHIL